VVCRHDASEEHNFRYFEISVMQNWNNENKYTDTLSAIHYSWMTVVYKMYLVSCAYYLFVESQCSAILLSNKMNWAENMTNYRYLTYCQAKIHAAVSTGYLPTTYYIYNLLFYITTITIPAYIVRL
jgi:hypothetical protein